jgi:nuclear pore complex protein Nup37
MFIVLMPFDWTRALSPDCFWFVHNSMNFCVFDPLVSTGDDHTCRMWNEDGEQEGCFQLSAPGMSVCVHDKDPGKVS